MLFSATLMDTHEIALPLLQLLPLGLTFEQCIDQINQICSSTGLGVSKVSAKENLIFLTLASGGKFGGVKKIVVVTYGPRTT